ncbi:MAG: type II secretion system minor pseudopilin GspI [Burkholderiales bacterium]|nr:type II secretion system minor pseudopilin GspI [Burkholderiales bacterium]
MTSSRIRSRGFTLIEVLVALAVLGIAMAAAVRATMSVTDGSLQLRRHLVGGWVAQNRLNGYIARGEFPSIGVHDGTEQQAGMQFAWQETVSDTPNQSFRRVEIRVTEPNAGDHADTILIGYVANVPR